jgi:Cof subfamily protein (haloacid dehalogenase superfamily)
MLEHDMRTNEKQAARLLVAVDMDGTLLDTVSEDRLRPHAIAALDAVRAAGHVVAICTGRNRRSLSRLLDRSGWRPPDLPLVLLNGAVVDGGRDVGLLSSNTIARDVLHELVELFRAHDAIPMIYDTEEAGETLHVQQGATNPVLGRYLAHRRMRVGAMQEHPDLLAALPPQALEVGTIDREDPIFALTEAVRRELDGRVRVINTQSLLGAGRYFWAEIYHPDCNKGVGVRLLADRLSIAPDRIVAIGDNYNDLDMFSMAAVSVAMSDGPPDVQATADRLAGPVTDGGAADVLLEIAAGRFDLEIGRPKGAA